MPARSTERPQLTATVETIIRASTLVASLVLAGGTVLVPALAQTHLGIHDAGVAIGQTRWMTLHEVQLKLDAMGYREVTKIARERDKFKIKATDAQGRRVDIGVDPVNGYILDTEVRRGKGDHTDTDQASWLTMHQVQVKLEAMGQLIEFQPEARCDASGPLASIPTKIGNNRFASSARDLRGPGRPCGTGRRQSIPGRRPRRRRS